MGSGKTTVGPLLSLSLDWPFVDLDDAIVRASQQTIDEIFQQSGEARFREFESIALEQTNKNDGLIIGCGGGIVMEERNTETLKKQFCIYLAASPASLMERIGATPDLP